MPALIEINDRLLFWIKAMHHIGEITGKKLREDFRVCQQFALQQSSRAKHQQTLASVPASPETSST